MPKIHHYELSYGAKCSYLSSKFIIYHNNISYFFKLYIKILFSLSHLVKMTVQKHIQWEGDIVLSGFNSESLVGLKLVKI